MNQDHEQAHKLAETALLSALAGLAVAYTHKLNREAVGGAAPAPSLASDVGPAAKPPKAKKQAEAPAAALAAAAPASVPAAPAPAAGGLTKEQDEASKKLALDTASAYVRHFSKTTPDGMTRARQVLADKFGGKKIAELIHDERLKFVSELKKEMELVGAAA